MSVVALRLIEESDLDALFDQMRDPAPVRMAAFTTEDPGDRSAFDAHMARRRSSPDITLRALICDGRLAGSIASVVFDGRTEVTYWIDRAAWGRGIATRAVPVFLGLAPVRPLYARAASDNAGAAGPPESRLQDHRHRDPVRGGTGRRNRGNHPSPGLPGSLGRRAHATDGSR